MNDDPAIPLLPVVCRLCLREVRRWRHLAVRFCGGCGFIEGQPKAAAATDVAAFAK